MRTVSLTVSLHYAVRHAYVEGIRTGDMADHGVMTVMARRYSIKVLVWNVPALDC
jgi:hypothetical protein